MANSSRVPAAIDQLIALLAAALPNVKVYDGPGVTDDANKDLLLIGVADPEDTGDMLGAESSMTWAAFDDVRDEDFTIWCSAHSENGESDLKKARDAAFATLAAAEAAIRSTPTLGGAILSGITDQITLRQNQNSSGAVAQVAFGVVCKADLEAV